MLTDKERRLSNATKALRVYVGGPGDDGSEWCNFVDLFADLLHLALSMGVDGEDCYRVGRDHYLVEVKEEVECGSDS